MYKTLEKLKSVYRLYFLSYLNERRVKGKLKAIDRAILSTEPQEIPGLFEKIPLDVFGKLYLDKPPVYPNIAAYFPSMASDADQDLWTGNHGWTLLNQSMVFVQSIVRGYQELTGENIRGARILDFGCGWGRLIRLLYKFVSSEQIYGVDPWERSIDICREHNVRAHLAVSDYVPHSIPFDVQFNLIYAFSVFTHLSEKTCAAALSTLRKYISDNGLLVITIRPRDYWLVHEKGVFASKMFAIHDEAGFAFLPHELPPIDGDVTYGDTSISLGYFERNFTQWKIVRTTVNAEDPYQILMFLRPV